MNHHRRLSAVVALALAASAMPAGAQTSLRPRPLATAVAAGTVSVVGFATITRAPDRARMSFTVTTNAPDAKSASTDNNVRYAAARSRLNVIGIPAPAIATVGFGITNNPRPAQPDPRSTQRYGYIVTRNVEVTIDDVSKVGAAVDASVEAGVTDVGNIAFGFRDDRAVMRAALAAAMTDAVAQADVLAESGHFHLGAPLVVGNAPQIYQPAQTIGRVMARQAAAADGYAPPTDVAPTPISVSASIAVTWRIAP